MFYHITLLNTKDALLVSWRPGYNTSKRRRLPEMARPQIGSISRSTMTKTPISLLERLRKPLEPEAWNLFVALYTPLIYTWARRAGLREEDAADLLQEVFMKLMEVLPTFEYDPHKGFRGWLRTVTLNTWRDHGKRRGNRPLGGNEAAVAAATLPDGLEAFWEAEYSQHLVNRAIALMQADFRPATWKAFWEQVVVGRPARAVAAELGLSPGAAYAAKFRVLDRLRAELAGMLD
jgi:RNA polymerase sigma-70 factor, ECF subfamily